MEAMEAELFLTGSALQYRRRRLMAAAECSGTADFLEFLNFCHDKGVLWKFGIDSEKNKYGAVKPVNIGFPSDGNAQSGTMGQAFYLHK